MINPHSPPPPPQSQTRCGLCAVRQRTCAFCEGDISPQEVASSECSDDEPSQRDDAGDVNVDQRDIAVDVDVEACLRASFPTSMPSSQQDTDKREILIRTRAKLQEGRKRQQGRGCCGVGDTEARPCVVS